MAQNDSAPRIRFKGFTDSWEQRKVSELLQERIEQAPKSEQYPLMAFTAYEGVTQKGRRYDRSSLVSDVSNKLYKRTETGDFIYSSNNLETGSIGLNHYGNACISPVYSIFKPTGLSNSDFIGRLFIRKSFINKMVKWRQGVVYGQWKIHESDFLKIGACIPSLKEQCAIGSYLNGLDKLITLHQRKYDKMTLLKKSMLEKMFPKDGKDVPEVRFAGFTDSWEQRKLGEVADRVTRKNEKLESELPLTISAQHGLIDQREYFNNQVASHNLSGYYLLCKGEFAYNKSTSCDSPWGVIKRLVRHKMGCVSTLYICFDAKDADPDYLVTYYETNSWHGEIRRIAAEGARNHGLLNISPIDFFETALMQPVKKSEQTKIGTFFQQLDKLITLHQRKLDALKKIKKSCLENMFV